MHSKARSNNVLHIPIKAQAQLPKFQYPSLVWYAKSMKVSLSPNTCVTMLQHVASVVFLGLRNTFSDDQQI